MKVKRASKNAAVMAAAACCIAVAAQPYSTSDRCRI
ncbi:hypothetical protein EDD30_0911 [Couchioplanes caeruleus]|uniref:Uncharacterized protein n=1 Tax=Couchioplanes caeruleus TaxID=56438 RepID=A0A3N1GDF5_9ACTN|nr:hypothetical protein EDD30_0911 [Couchioplanes caeruleus]